jgi:broad specificity phosphatase PhoE
MRVNLYWTRHGLSCANALKLEGHSILEDILSLVNLGKSRGQKYPNAQLTEIGVEQCIKTNQKVKESKKIPKKFDLICSSELLRAIETASLMYFKPNQLGKKHSITILPFINEFRWNLTRYLGIDKDNEPQTVNKTIKRYKKFAKHIDYKKPPQLNYNFLKKNFHQRTEADIEMFKEEVLPLLLKKFKKKKEVHIAIVCHRVYMKKYFDSKTQYNNTAVVLQSFDWTNCCEIENEEVNQIYEGLNYMGFNM